VKFLARSISSSIAGGCCFSMSDRPFGGRKEGSMDEWAPRLARSLITAVQSQSVSLPTNQPATSLLAVAGKSLGNGLAQPLTDDEFTVRTEEG
jgi:hypothetical protein